jgi:hypothetical protein
MADDRADAMPVSGAYDWAMYLHLSGQIIARYEMRELTVRPLSSQCLAG